MDMLNAVFLCIFYLYLLLGVFGRRIRMIFFSEVSSVSDLFFTRIYCERWRGGFDPYESVEGATNAESYATVEWTYSERYMMP